MSQSEYRKPFTHNVPVVSLMSRSMSSLHDAMMSINAAIIYDKCFIVC